jgi:hypothetical protein
MSVHEFTLFADYFQFYIQDQDAPGIDGDSWDGDAPARMLAVEPGTIGVGTVRNKDVPVTLEILGSEPAQDFENWDHVTECSLTSASGKLVVAGCTGLGPDAARVEIEPGTYRARVAYGGLYGVEKHWEGSGDRYRVQLWKAPAIEPRVIKQRRES